MKNVQFVRGTYKARIIVPQELRSIVGKTELVENLGADKKAAEKRGLAALAGFHALLDEAREVHAANQPTLSLAAKQHYRSELLADSEERSNGKMPNMSDFRSVYAAKLELVASGRIINDEAEALIGYAADALKAQGQAPNVSRSDFLKALAEVQLEALLAFEARNSGALKLPEPKSALLATPDRAPAKLRSNQTDRGTGKTLPEIVDAFHKERMAGSGSITEKTLAEHRVAVRMLEEFLGKGIPAASITRKDMLAYKGALLETPTNYVQRFPGLTLPQAIKKNSQRAQPFPTLNPKTINVKWLAHLSSIFTWAMSNGFVDQNPASKIRVETGRKDHQEATRVDFSNADLKAMFGHAMFSDPANYGTHQWALLLALYTGARSAELARIKLVDIFEEDGVPAIFLSGASKNNRSKRLIPIHAKLIELGFLAYVEKLRLAHQVDLFREWKPEHKVNRWFLRTFKIEVGITDPRKVFHSFRHTLKTAMAHAGVPRDISDKITGHADQSVAGVYIHGSMVKSMSVGLNTVTFLI